MLLINIFSLNISPELDLPPVVPVDACEEGGSVEDQEVKDSEV